MSVSALIVLGLLITTHHRNNQKLALVVCQQKNCRKFRLILLSLQQLMNLRMRRLQIRYYLSLLLVLSAFCVNAQPENMLLRYLRTEEGLSQNEVTSILQDNEGFMWFGTRSGLNRYDGYDFQVFNMVPGDSNSLVNTSVEQIYKDRMGVIWIGTKSNGISRYNPVTGKFLNIPFNDRSAGKILPNKRVISFCEDSNGEMWIGTLSGGLAKYNSESNTSKFYLDAININVILKSADGIIWVGTDNGVFEYDRSSDAFTQPQWIDKNIHVSSIIEDKNHQDLWILGNPQSFLLR